MWWPHMKQGSKRPSCNKGEYMDSFSEEWTCSGWKNWKYFKYTGNMLQSKYGWMRNVITNKAWFYHTFLNTQTWTE